MAQLVQLQKDFKQIEKAGISLVGISYDSTETLNAFTKRNKIAFTLLSDQESKAIDAYKLRNKDVREGSRQDGIPHPVTIIVDNKGVVRAKLAESVRKRHTTKELIDAVNKIRQEDEKKERS